jgi:bacillithiol synthase
MSKPDKSIFELYKKNDPGIASFFSRTPEADWKNICEAVLKNYQNTGFIDILIRQNNSIQNQKYLNILKEKNTVILITGQQLGLFVSPMYTIYKILTTILYAQKLSEEITDYNFVPVFWLEGEDHDFAEVNHIHFFTQEGDLEELVYNETDNEKGLSISKRNLTDEITKILKLIREKLQHTEFTEPLLNGLEHTWEKGIKWHDAFSDQIRTIFKASGLLLFNPADTEVKKASHSFFKYLIENNDAIVKAFLEQSKITQEAGFANQVYVDSDKSYIFLSYKNAKRLSLQKEQPEHFFVKDSNLTWSRDELLAILEKNPEWFSSTVLTRPIWQSWMLPVVSYIAGPSEIAYWAQLKKGFDAFKVQMPHVMPRLSFTLLEPKIQRLLKKYSIDIDDVDPDADNFIKEQLKKAQPPELENQFNELNKNMDQHKSALSTITEKIDPTLQSVVKKTFGNVDHSFKKLQDKLLKRLENKESLLVRHFKEIHDNIYPDGTPQERIICSIYYMNKYGPDWLNNINGQIKMDNFDRQTILL